MLKNNSANILGAKHSQEWYYERVGKKIRKVHGRPKHNKALEMEVKTTGIMVHSKIFAEYLYDLQQEQNYRYEDLETVTIQIIQP